MSSSYSESTSSVIKKFLPVIIGGIVALVLLITGFIFIQKNLANGTKSDFGKLEASYIRDYNYRYGLKNAPVKYIYLFDFSCAACQANSEIFEQTYEAYKDKVEFVFKNYVAAHKGDGDRSAKAAMAAGEQGKYLEYYKKLIAITKAQGNGNVSGSKYEEIAGELGLDTIKFNKDYNSLKIEEREKQEQKDVADAIVPASEYSKESPKPASTPSIVIVKDGKVATWWSGVIPLEGNGNNPGVRARIDKVMGETSPAISSISASSNVVTTSQTSSK